jgi:6-pyruvoyltetrahydropterin/6-carboxytetrahydropterin synthase
MPRVTVHRKAHFNAAHRLYRKDWSDEKNFEVFNKCSNPNFHGHNYELIVSLTGEIDNETGYVFDLGILKNHIKSEIEDAFDHKNLNLEVPENICVVTYDKLRNLLPTNLDLEVTLYETPRNFVSYSGS